ncbi:MAG: hypothetical protein U7127_08800 [Phormidium sp.]
MYDSLKSQEDLISNLKKSGKTFSKAICTTQIFPKDGALLQYIPVEKNLLVGAQLEKDLDSSSGNTWCLILVVDSTDQSLLPRPASYELVKKYLEEFIICTKACIAAYKKLKGTAPYLSSASSDAWLANNYMAVFFSLEKLWDVQCKGVDIDPNKCLLELQKKIILKLELEPEKLEVEQKKVVEFNYSSSSSLTNVENPSDDSPPSSNEKRLKKLIALGIGCVGIFLLLYGFWFIALICLVTCLVTALFLWKIV